MWSSLLFLLDDACSEVRGILDKIHQEASPENPQSLASPLLKKAFIKMFFDRLGEATCERVLLVKVLGQNGLGFSNKVLEVGKQSFMKYHSLI